jgi:hypothetical protein
MRLRFPLLLVTSTLGFCGFGCGSASDAQTEGPETPPTRGNASTPPSTSPSLVLFGGERALDPSGSAPPKFLGDTWTWDGTRWNPIQGAGPSARASAAMIGF